MRIALLLRGVNVGGVTVRSADLRTLLVDAGLEDARTVLASGNAIVTGSDVEAARDTAERALAERYGRTVRVAARSLDALRAIVDGFPFAEDDEHTPYVVLGLEDEVLDRLAEVETPEPLMRVDDALCWSNPRGTTTDSPFGRALVRIGRDAITTRNLRTLRRILEVG